jgi:hypothetical protein
VIGSADVGDPCGSLPVAWIVAYGASYFHTPTGSAPASPTAATPCAAASTESTSNDSGH